MNWTKNRCKQEVILNIEIPKARIKPNRLHNYIFLEVKNLSMQRYIAQTGPFYVASLRFTTQPIKLQRFVKFCYAVIAHTEFHEYLATNLLLFYANFQRFISNEWCSKSKRITVLTKKAKHSTTMNPLLFLACQFF